MIVGIDPGYSGAIAFLHKEGSLTIFDMPLFTVNGKKKLDIATLHSIFSTFETKHVYVEQVNAFGMGRSSAFNFGFGCGVIEALLTAGGHSYTKVTPQQWKRATKTPKDKDGARMRASQVFPDQVDNWPLKKHDGRAEAALIAMWGRDWA